MCGNACQHTIRAMDYAHGEMAYIVFSKEFLDHAHISFAPNLRMHDMNRFDVLLFF